MYESPPPAENPRRRAIIRLIAWILLLIFVATLVFQAIGYY
jgi:hypothetical protein